MFNSIVVAIDGSDHAEKAAAVAADMAAKYAAEMTLLHVLPKRDISPADVRRLIDVETLPSNLREGFERFEGMQEKKEVTTAGYAIPAPYAFPEDVLVGVGDAILDKAEAIAKEHGASKIERVLAKGDPASIILDCARDKNANLIVMGTRGLSDLGGLLVGSVSHKVSHLADCTCITVR